MSSDVPVGAPWAFGCGCALCAGQTGAGQTGAGRTGSGLAGFQPGGAGQGGAQGDLASSIAALLPSGSPKWGAATAGTAATVTYSFMESAPSYAGTSDRNGFAPMTQAQRSAVRQALAAWAEVANITFTEVADTGAGGSMRFGTNAQNGTSVGYAYYPSLHFATAGDVYLANDSSGNVNPTAGTYGFKTILHEIGHAIGLKHPGNYNAGGGGTEGPYLPSAEDNYQYTLMSYNGHPSLGYSGLSAGPALYDIAAIQYLYGANTQTRTGSDTYALNELVNPFSACIWDAAGTDTIDISQQTLNATIDLRAGAFSSVGSNGAGETAVGNISIAYGVTIENATGGAGSDALIGNAAANTLIGGAGNDTLTGGDGHDTLDGGTGTDTAVFAGNRADYDISRSGTTVTVSHRFAGAAGTDTLTNVEYVRFSDRTVGLRPPTVLPAVVSVVVNQSLDGSSLFTATDHDNAQITAYEVLDGTGNGGYFTLNGAQLAAGTPVSVSTLSSLRFIGGPAEGTDQISIRAYNGALWSDWTTWTMTTRPPNRSPSVQSDRTISVQEGGPATPLGLPIPVDVDGDALTVTIQSVPGGGSLKLGNGTTVSLGTTLSVADIAGLAFTPAAGFSGSAGSFAYTVADGKGGTAQQTVSFQVLSLASQLASFDPLVYLASNPDLITAFGSDTAAARYHFSNFGRFEGRPTNSFDPYAYLVANPDVAAGVGINRTEALNHYLRFGRNEGRTTSTGFSAQSYLAANPDLLSAFGTDEAAATRHYLEFGRREGRTTSFNALGYLAANPDLAQAFGTSQSSALSHYLQYGRAEGRSTRFDSVAYVAANPDLIPVIGTNTAAAEMHYIQYGRTEGRRLSFDASSYLAANPDVAAVVGGNSTAATLHYVQYGFAEGRSVSRVRPSGLGLPEPAMSLSATPSLLAGDRLRGTAGGLLAAA